MNKKISHPRGICYAFHRAGRHTQTHTKKYLVCLLLFAFCLLPAAYCFLPTSYSLLLTAYSCEASDSSPRVHFIDVGEGAATWIEVGDGRHILVDTGNVITGARVRTTLQEAGVERLETIIITHPHPDHMGGIFHLLPVMEVGRVLDNGQPIASLPSCDIYRWYVEAVRSRANYGVLNKGDRLQWGPVQIEILWPPSPTSTNWNSNALVIRLKINDKCILLMSDVGHSVEARLLAEKIDLKAEVLQVGHHGAPDASSEIFLRAVAPEWAIISVNSNNVRGYPSEDVLQKLRAVKAKVFLTSDNGTCTWGPGLDAVGSRK
ncbi:MAG: MBL fold metallo-hydrolase [Deltaproteobacteria bacterium]|nr:MBL fold metallo-hydrolase [Deltaproteobacteria bacterium]